MEGGGGYGANPGVCLARLLGARANHPPPSHKLLQNYSLAYIDRGRRCHGDAINAMTMDTRCNARSIYADGASSCTTMH